MATTATDTLEPLGIGLGALLVLVGIATLVGTPWAHKSGGLLLAAGQVLGAISAVAIGAGLAWIARK
ncbi:hypothetical protein NGM10_08375 [Halorussus salilacus]|uniref:hypothetical protein n=1 Tax=Halorussus salilacus TaxID=2953750 RepID=UPI0020A0678D|nr:hypothetical protein [Halorussus salilacus]USZ66757.1 hypothetical protein NGM10_08375 [Halorussus salilacus]